MSVGYRPPGSGPEAPKYLPDRDLAYITPTVILTAMNRLDETRWVPELRAYMVQSGLTWEKLSDVIKAYGEAQRLYTTKDAVTDVGQALMQAGFFECSYAYRQLMYASLGEVLTAAYFQAVRDVTNVDQAPSRRWDIAQVISLAQTLHRCAHDIPPPAPDRLSAQLEDLQMGLQATQVRADKAESDYKEFVTTTRASDATHKRLLTVLEEERYALQTDLDAADAEITRLESQSLWQMIWARLTKRPR